MRILSIPGRTHENRYFQLFCDSLEQAGLKLITIRERAALLFRFDVLHVHFPTHFLTENKPAAAVIWALVEMTFLLLCVALGKPIIYTVHDVVPFNPRNGYLVKHFLAIFYPLCSGYVFLSATSKAEFLRSFPSQHAKPSVLISHGPYPTRMRTPLQRSEARRRLTTNDSDLLVGFLGQIKPYKNLDVLPLLPSVLANGRRTKLVVAGRVDESYRSEANNILSLIAPESLVRIDRRLSDDELDDLMQACDVVLLPYEKGSNSGAAMLSLSNRTRMLGSNLPMFRELECLLPYWSKTFITEANCGGRSLAAAINDIASSLHPSAVEDQCLTRFLEATSFQRSASRLKTFYRSITSKDPCAWWRLSNMPKQRKPLRMDEE